MYFENMTKGEARAFIIDAVLEALKSNKDAVAQTFKTQEDGLSTIEKVCNHFDISKPTIYNWLKKGVFVKYKVGNGTRFKISEIDKAMKDFPHLFGEGRDYNFRNKRMNRDECDLNRIETIEARFRNGIHQDDRTLNAYRKYCEKHARENIIDK